MSKKVLIYFLSTLLCLDLGYSFMQYYNTPLDGDMAVCIVPAEDVKKIFADPFGISVFSDNTGYPNPNRFFSHYFYRVYFRTIPLFLQNFTNPIDSIYLAAALAKLCIYMLILFLLSSYISGTLNFFRRDFLISAVLVIPLFQTNGYRIYMGIIDPSITYTFFYALPIGLLLLFYLPFIKQAYHNEELRLSIYTKISLLILAIFIAFSGPLNPGVVLIITLLFLVQRTMTNGRQSLNSIQRNDLFLLLPISILSVYSLYVGSFNSLSPENSIGELYSKLPAGLFYQFTQKLGFPILLSMIAINSIIIRKYHNNSEGKKILSSLSWIGIFALIFIILLPLGGFRDYRPNILRYDTIMPITLSLIFIYGASTLFLINSISKKNRKWYLLTIAIVSLAFTNADKPDFHKNDCEKQALVEIANSTEDAVLLESDCNVLSWVPIRIPGDSKLNSELLNYWNITKGRKLYYHKLPLD